MRKQVGYVGQRKRDGKWFARIKTGGEDRTRFAATREKAEKLLATIALAEPEKPSVVMSEVAFPEQAKAYEEKLKWWVEALQA